MKIINRIQVLIMQKNITKFKLKEKEILVNDKWIEAFLFTSRQRQ